MKDIARDLMGYQQGKAHFAIRRLWMEIFRAFGFKMPEMEAEIVLGEANLEAWADEINEEAACTFCLTTPEPHSKHRSPSV